MDYIIIHKFMPGNILDTTLCLCASGSWHIEGMWCLHLQDSSVQKESSLTAWLKTWRQQDIAVGQEPLSQWHRAIHQKNRVFNSINVTHLNLQIHSS